MDGRPPFKVEEPLHKVIFMIDEIKKYADEYSVNESYYDIDEIRFSNNECDLNNVWSDHLYNIFAASGRRIVNIEIQNKNDINNIEFLMKNAVENPSYNGINNRHYSFEQKDMEMDDLEIYEIMKQMVDSAKLSGADSSAGLVYKKKFKNRVITNYNDIKYITGGYEIVIRSFKDGFSGQESVHTGFKFNIDPYRYGELAAETARKTSKKIDIDEGKYDIILSPYALGTIMTYNSNFFSYYNIDAGISPFIDLLNSRVGPENLTLNDEPLNMNGIGYRPVDDEGTLTSNKKIIDHGVLKTYLHSYSTSVKAGTATTGNAGIIHPVPWQLSIEPGSRSYIDIINDIDTGIFINNSWYTRFQDQRAGIFSTVPRDGVFYIKYGEIVGSVSGIRISDSIINILGNLQEVSRERVNVKWWDEIHPSIMPYALVNNINISKGF